MMTNVEIKKHGIFEKTRKDKRDIGYQTIGGSRSSIESSYVTQNPERSKTIDENLVLNAAVNLKKSKTFKIIVNKKGKEKEKSKSKKDKSVIKTKKRKREEVNIDVAEIESDKAKECIEHLFGVSLSEACKYSKSHDGYPLPAFFRLCIDYLESDNRLSFEGIYRIPGVNSQIAKLKQTLNTETDIADLLIHFDIAVVTSIVKSFLRDLKPDIIARNLETLFFKTLETHKDNIQEKVSVVKKLINEQLPKENQYLLALVINHMEKIIDMSHQNKMTLDNLLIVLSPALHLHFQLLKFFYDHSSELFMELQVPPYVPPIKPGPEHEEELPESVEGINEELKKQISYLDDLHEQINQGLGTKKIEYLIWEVQLIVTKLKRKKYIVELQDPDLIKNELTKYERQLKRLHKDMLVVVPTGPATASSPPVGGAAIQAVPNSMASSETVTVGAPSSLDQELWQVQRTITTLNRKLKSLSFLNKASFENVAATVFVPSKMDNGKDDDDDDSIQLNLTLRKIPIDVSEILDDEEEVELDGGIDCNLHDCDTEEDVIEPDECVHASTEVISTEIPNTDTDLSTTCSDKSPEDLNVPENYIHLFPAENDYSTSSNGAINTTVTEDYQGSNSESQMTGSNMATNIDDLIQTGEIWTNEKEELLPEDEDLRNEAIRSLYIREELISIRNDLKTRITSESNEIQRLKRNIEELSEERLQKTFRAQNKYHKLDETVVDVADDDDEDDDNAESSSEEEDDELDSSSEECESRPLPLATEDADIADLVRQQAEIVADNDRLEKENIDLLEQIQLERSHCVDLKVALRTHVLLACASPWPPGLDE